MKESDSFSSHAYRHRAREVALQALYALDLQRLRADRETRRAAEPDPSSEGEAAERAELADVVFARVAEHFEMPAVAEAFARDLVAEVNDHAAELDVILASHADNWRVDRMATVDRNILRLAAYELQCTETPAAVILDEAVELARRYGSDRSPSFVNGVLDAVAHKVRGGLPE